MRMIIKKSTQGDHESNLMTASTDPKPPTRPQVVQSVRRVDLSTILGGDREIVIRHRDEEYRLRLTSNDKLLLTK